MKRWIGIFALILTILPVWTVKGKADDGPSGGKRNFDIYFIDVLGGAATLLITPERESVLIDSGWAGFDDRDPKRIVHVLKDVAKLDQLDHAVTTHWHADHFGGIAGIAWAVQKIRTQRRVEREARLAANPTPPLDSEQPASAN